MEQQHTGQDESQPQRKKKRRNDAAEGSEQAALPSATPLAEPTAEAAESTETGISESARTPLTGSFDALENNAEEPKEGLRDESVETPTEDAPTDRDAVQARQNVAAVDADEQAEVEAPASEQTAGEPVGAAASEDEEILEEGEEAEPEELLPDGLPMRQVVEAVLFATDTPLPANKIAQILERGTSRHVRRFIKDLNEQYEREGRAFRIEEVAGGYQMLTVTAMQPWLVKLLRARQESRLSPTQMETLAVVAYKQPVLRAAVEVVRGVACGDVINRLREMGLVKIVGRAEDVGRPLLYGTTKKFLRVFGLGSLEDLPRAEELRPPEAVQPAAPKTSEPTREPQAEPPPATANQ